MVRRGYPFKLLIKNSDDLRSNITINVVYKEVFDNLI